jgi:hypothetical protein
VTKKHFYTRIFTNIKVNHTIGIHFSRETINVIIVIWH